MDSTTPQTPYDLDTRLNTINELAKTAHGRSRWEDGDKLFALAFKLLGLGGISANKEDVQEALPQFVCKRPFCLICRPEANKTVEYPCTDPGCGICHPWNKEVV